MSTTNPIIPETEIFEDNLIRHEERAKYYPDNLPNLTNPLAPNIQVGNNKFTFKEASSKPARLDFVEGIRKEIFAHKDDQNWNIVIRRHLNGKNPIMHI